MVDGDILLRLAGDLARAEKQFRECMPTQGHAALEILRLAGDRLRDFIDQPLAPAWTKEKPTAPGWYWVYGIYPRLDCVEVFAIGDEAHTLNVCMGNEIILEVPDNCKWAGPIPVPAASPSPESLGESK